MYVKKPLNLNLPLSINCKKFNWTLVKKLNKLLINPAKLIKSEDLVTLRGGYGGGTESALCRKIEYDFIITLGVVCVSGCNSDVALDACVNAGYTNTSFAQCLSVPCAD